jgi:hypothetical protein
MEAVCVSPDPISQYRVTPVNKSIDPWGFVYQGRIYEYNLSSKMTIIPFHENTVDCRIVKHRHRKPEYYLPIAKTSLGCILDCVNNDRESRIEKICGEKSDCPLLKVKFFIESDSPLSDENIKGLHDYVFGKDPIKPTESIEPIEPIEPIKSAIDTPLNDFIKDCCEMKGQTDIRQLKEKYLNWCRERSREPLSNIQFNEILKSVGCEQKFIKIVGKSQRIWTNITLK